MAAHKHRKESIEPRYPTWPRSCEEDSIQVRYQRVVLCGREKGELKAKFLRNHFYVRDSEREVTRSGNIC